MNVHFAATASKTRMKPSDTKTRFMSAATHGHARHYQAMTGHFTIRQVVLGRRILAATVATSSLAQAGALVMGL